MRRRPLGWLPSAAVGALVGLFCAAPVSACAVCGTGDSTLTAMGTEQPFAGRLRSALQLRYRTDAIGRSGVDRTRVREFRTDLWTAWAPREDLFVIAEVPMLYRQVSDVNLAQSEAWGLGDVALSVKWFAFRDRAFAPRWLVSLLCGMKFPSAPWLEDSEGNRLPLEAQPGSGSFDVSLGPSLAAFLGPFSGYASLIWLEPVLTRELMVPGRSLRASVAIQYQMIDPLAARFVSDIRWDQSTEEDLRRDPHSGGTIAFVGADVLLSPSTDFATVLGVRLPAMNRLYGAHVEGPMFSLAFVRDW